MRSRRLSHQVIARNETRCSSTLGISGCGFSDVGADGIPAMASTTEVGVSTQTRSPVLGATKATVVPLGSTTRSPRVRSARGIQIAALDAASKRISRTGRHSHPLGLGSLLEADRPPAPREVRLALATIRSRHHRLRHRHVGSRCSRTCHKITEPGLPEAVPSSSSGVEKCLLRRERPDYASFAARARRGGS